MMDEQDMDDAVARLESIPRNGPSPVSSPVSLGDEESVVSPIKSKTDFVPVVQPKRVSKKATIGSVIRNKISVQLGMMVMGVVPLSQRLLHAFFSVLADATARPGEGSGVSVNDWNDWIEHVEMEGKAGETKTVRVDPQVYFQCARLHATDSFSERGRGTRILGWFIGSVPQMTTASGNGIRTARFSDRLFRGAMCHPGTQITFIVSFVEDCIWECDLFGKGLQPVFPHEEET